MKKNALLRKSLIFVVVFMFVFVGCSANNQPQKNESNNNNKANENVANKNEAKDNNNSNDKEEQVSGEILVWSSLSKEEVDGYAARYNKVNPNVKVENVVLPYETYMTKVQAVLQSRAGVPDVFLFEISQFDTLRNTDLLENLSKEPYNAGDYEDEMIPYIVDLSKDSDGNFRGLTWQSTPGGFWYKKALARKYLGTDDPDDMFEMLKDWDLAAETGKKVYENSGGETYLFSGPGAVVTPLQFEKNSYGGYVKDGKLISDDYFRNVFEKLQLIRDNNGDAMLKNWSAAWGASIYEENKFIILGLPSWGLHYAIKANTPSDATDTDDTWGYCRPSSPYQSGGTWLSMYAESENKEAGFDYIKTLSLNPDYLKMYVEDTGDFIGHMPTIEEVIASGHRDPFTGDQNIYEYMYEAAKIVDNVYMTKYDQAVQGTLDGKIELVLTKEITIDEAIDQIKNEIKNQFPNIEVE